MGYNEKDRFLFQPLVYRERDLFRFCVFAPPPQLSGCRLFIICPPQLCGCRLFAPTPHPPPPPPDARAKVLFNELQCGTCSATEGCIKYSRGGGGGGGTNGKDLVKVSVVL